MSSDEYSKNIGVCAGCGKAIDYDEYLTVVSVDGVGYTVPRFQVPHTLCWLCSERLDDWFEQSDSRQTPDEIKQSAIEITATAGSVTDTRDGSDSMEDGQSTSESDPDPMPNQTNTPLTDETIGEVEQTAADAVEAWLSQTRSDGVQDTELIASDTLSGGDVAVKFDGVFIVPTEAYRTERAVAELKYVRGSGDVIVRVHLLEKGSLEKGDDAS